MYKISVIIPVYNAAIYIDDCIGSLKAQTIGFNNLEVIMIDDCSTDNSRERMRFYAQQYNNVKCIYLSENSGAAGKPRNEGIKEAHADYIMFIDPDDKYYPEACKSLFDKIEETGGDLVSGYYSTFDSEKGMLEKNALMAQNIKETIYNMPADMEKIMKFRYHFAAKIYKNSTISAYNIHFAEKIIGQDSAFFMEYLFHSYRVYYIQTPILQYRQRNQKDKSVSYDLSKKHFCDIVIAMQIIKELFVRNGMEDKLNLVFDGVVEYYIRQIIDSDLDEQEICDILKQWEWLFEYACECKEELSYSNIVLTGYCKDDFTNLAKMIVSLRTIKRYIEEIEKAKDWWKQQSDNKDKETKETEKAKDWWKQQSDSKDKEIKEIEKARDWWKRQSDSKDKEIKEIEKARDWWKRQSDSKDKEIKEIEKARDWWKRQSNSKDKEIEKTEKARDWWKQQSDGKDKEIEETEKARDWWKQQSDNFEKQVLELKDWILELEEAKEYFQGEIRKRDEEIEQLKKVLP